MKRVNCVFYSDYAICQKKDCVRFSKQCVEFYAMNRCEFKEELKRPIPPSAPPKVKK